MQEPSVNKFTVNDLIEVLNDAGNHRGEASLKIEIHNPGSVGGTPGVMVKAAYFGIDWDANTLLLRPEKPLTSLTPEQVKEISESVRIGSSWHAYESYKKQKKALEDMQSQRDTCIGTLTTLLNSAALTDEQKTMINSCLAISGGVSLQIPDTLLGADNGPTIT